MRAMMGMAAAAFLAGCAVSGSTGDGGPAGMQEMPSAGNGPDWADNAPRGTLPGVQIGCNGPCQDFPAEPIFDPGAPANAPQLFGAADNAGASGVCVLEPQLGSGDEPGALFPRNWLQPRFRFTPLSGETLWEVRLSSPYEQNDLVAFTTNTSWTMPRDLWKALAMHVVDQPITVTIRGVNASAPGVPSSTGGTFTIAPVEARGKMVYWATTSSEVKPDTSKLVGFDVGDESVIDALTVPQVGDRGVVGANGRDVRGTHDDPKGVPPGHAQCIGCHVSTPDGTAVAFTDHWPWNSLLASIEAGTVGARPAYLSAGAEVLLNQPWLGMQTFSQMHWSPSDRIVVVAYSPRNSAQMVGFSDAAPYPSRADRLAWIDLETTATFAATPAQGDVQMLVNQQIQAASGTSFGLLAMDGETRSVAAPHFSHDGTRIVYTSAEATQDGRLSAGREADLHIVPWNDRQGGTITPVAGASEPGVAEYYPAFSVDDRLIAFTRVQSPDGAALYYRPDGEVFVIPSEGGTAVRLRANDPPACGGERSPGVINSWPKWSPSVMTIAPSMDEFGTGNRTYYWLIFSSARAYPGRFELPRTQYSPPDTRSSQLYVTAVVRGENGEISTYPAVYLWNQDPTTSNLTPAWEEFKIPPVPGPD